MASRSMTALRVRGSDLPDATRDSSRSRRKMMSSAEASYRASQPDYGTRPPDSSRFRAALTAATATGGIIPLTSPPKAAISFTRLELT